MKITLPYGHESISVNISDEKIGKILTSRVNDYHPEKSESELVKEALKNTVSSPALCELAEYKKKITVITSDHTRPVPSKITMPLLLEEIRKGNPEAEITILIATGFHRASTDEELRKKFGDEIIDQEKIVIHDSRNKEMQKEVGILPSGGKLILNKMALETDFLVAEGFIEPHFFAGFSGGRKSILPGVASKETVLANHCSEFINHPQARTGILAGNPIHKDMLFAAEKANLSFILNVVINEDKKIINAFAGDREKAHEKGCQFVEELAGVSAGKAEVVITSNGGYPLDQNIYQAVKSMTAAEAVCKENGVIIVSAECSDGHGGDDFYQTFLEADSPEDVMKKIMARNRAETVADQWESQILARVLSEHRVILVTEASQKMVENMHLQWAPSLDQALQMAENWVGGQYKINVIPDGVAVIVK